MAQFSADEPDLPRLFDEIVAIVRSPRSVREGMARVLDLCAGGRPHPDWERLRALDIESDVRQVKSFVEDLLASDPPPATATGLWFGLFNPVRRAGRTADIHVLGAPYEPGDPDWATRGVWYPSRAELRSEVLDGIYKIAYGSEEEVAYDEDGEPLGDLLRNDAEYPLCLAYAALVVRTVGSELHPSLFVTTAPERVLFAGFDSGDWICVGAVGAQGLRLSENREGMPWPGTARRLDRE